MKELGQKAAGFIRLHKAALIINAVICMICYGRMAFSENVGIDTEHVINYPGVSMEWEMMGRQGLLYTKRLFGVMIYNPYLNGILFVGGFILLGSLAAFLFWTASGEDDRYPYGWFAALFSACPVWMMQFYFALQRAEAVWGMIYGTLSVFALAQIVFFRRRKAGWFLSCLLFGMWSFASYQGCVLLYVSLCAACYLLDFFRDPDRKPVAYLKHIFCLVAGFLAVYFAYTMAVRSTMANGWYLQGQVMWGKWPVKKCLSLIFDHAKCLLNWYRPDNVSAYPLACACALLLFGIYIWKKKKNALSLLLGLAGLLLTPFLMSLYLGNKALGRSQFALPVAAAFACMLFLGVCGMWQEEGLLEKGRKPSLRRDDSAQGTSLLKRARRRGLLWTRRACMLAGVVMIWSGMSVILALQYTDDIRYRDDVNTARTIAADLYQTKGYQGLPVIFVGEKDAELNGACLAADLYGYSFFKWDYSDGNPTGATWRILGFMRTLGIDLEDGSRHAKKAIAAAEDMPYYPEKGYISVEDKFVVVKLSEVPSSKSRKPAKARESWKLW